jgi:translation initiation factor IF-1
MRLEARRRRAVVRSEGREHDVAVVEWDQARSARITLSTGEEFLLQGAGRRHRWEIRRGDNVLIDVTAFQAFVKASVEFRTNAAVPEETGLLLCVIGGFTALRDLRTQVDAGASVGAIVASGIV